MSPSLKGTRKRSVTSGDLQSFDALVVGAGLDPASFFRDLKNDLARTADPLRAANNLHRFLSNAFSATVLHDFQKHPILQKIALEIFGQSQYLADILVRDPELFRWVTTSNALKITKSRSDFVGEALASLQLFTRLEKKLDSLKRFHRREMLRIGSRDILKEAGVPAITAELSGLADGIIEGAMELAHHELGVRTGTHVKNAMAVIGLGKLGGEELNFSSDIDLLFVYDQDGEIESADSRIRTLHEYYNRFAEIVVRTLTDFTPEGHLYRVDMRLRPEGNAGPLAMSRLAYNQYYESRGELWERQMLLKARPVAGNPETGLQFVRDIKPFVFPRTLLESPLQEIREMKKKIEQRVERDVDIKLGEGGIRDIEFIVQALQLLGGREESILRQPNTLMGLQTLSETGHLGKKEAERMEQSYEFFRTVEHRLQLLHGTQTHSLPDSRAETSLLARRLGFKTPQDLTRRIERERKGVRKIFNSVFPEQSPGRKLHKKSSSGGVSGVPVSARKEIRRLASVLQPLHEADIQNEFLGILKQDGAPEWAVRNFELLVDSVPLKRTLVQAFSRRELLELLVRISSRSRRMTEVLSREPLLFETLVGQPEQMFSEETGWSFLLTHDLPRFKSYNEFKILLRFLMGEKSIQETVAALSRLAEFILAHAFSSVGGSKDICVVGLGKLGGREITAGSDIDIVVVYDRDTVSSDTAEGVAKGLLAQFADPNLYAVDCRLRPEGTGAPLATEIHYYEEYMSKRASLWERQSMTKARPICGSPELGGMFLAMAERHAYLNPLPHKWEEETMRMRTRIEKERSKKIVDFKLSKGGLVDLEFSLQMLQMKMGGKNADVRVPNSFEAATALSRILAANKLNTKSVLKNLEFLRSLETMIRLNSDKTDFVLPAEASALQALSSAMGLLSPHRLQQRIQSIRLQNRTLLLNAVGLCKSR